MDYKNSDLPWCANCIYGIPEENGNNIYCKQIEGWRIEDEFCGLHEWRNTIIRGIVEGKGNMDRLTYKTNGKYANTTAEQMPPYSIDCDIDTAITKLAEYENLEEHGKMLRLPVAVGDIIWDIDFGRPCSYEVTGFSFGSLNDDDWEEEKVLDQVVVCYTNSNGSITGTFAVGEIGKTVFFTKEDAESALKELERGKEMSNDLISRSALMQSLRGNVLVSKKIELRSMTKLAGWI